MALRIGKDPMKQELPKDAVDSGSSRNKGLGKTDRSKRVISQDKTISNTQPNKKAKALVPVTVARTVDPTVSGGGYNSDGQFVTAKGQLLDAIKRGTSLNDNRSIDQIADEFEAAKSFDQELSYEQKKAQALVDPIKVANETPVEDTYLTTSDIENEFNQTLEGIDAGDPDAINTFNNLSNYLKTQPVKYGEPAIERLGLEEYYPDINTPLQVGSYQGSIVGSNPIFVAGGGYFPFSILDARKRAMETAAANRVKEGEKIKELMLVDSAEQYQGQLSDIGLDIFNKYGEMTGWDYRKITDMKNPEAREFYKEYNQYRDMAKRTLSVQKQYENLLKEIEGGKYAPPHVWETLTNWKSGMYNIEEMMQNPEFIMKIEKDLHSYDNMIKDGNTLKDKIDYEKDFAPDPTKEYTEEDLKRWGEEIEFVKNTSNYDVLRTRSFSFVPMDRIIALVDETVDNGHYYNPEQTKVDLTRYVSNLLATEITASYETAYDKSTRVNVNVNNVPPDVSIVKDIYNKSTNPQFVKGVNDLLTVGADKLTIDNYLATNLGVDPIEDTPYLDGIIPLGEEAGRNDFLSTNELEIYYDKTGEWLTHSNWSVSTLKDKYGLADSQISEYKRIYESSDYTQEEISKYLSDLGVSKDDAIIFSKTGTSTISGELTSADVMYGYTDENGRFVPYTVDSTPQSNSKAMVYDNYNMFDEAGNVFAGIKVRKPSDINLTVPAASYEEGMSGESAALKRLGKHGTAESKNSGNFAQTGNSTGTGSRTSGATPRSF